jgi:hypothetical protein
MANANIVPGFLYFLAEANHFGICMHSLPTLDCIQLDDRDVALKRLRRNKKSKHG